MLLRFILLILVLFCLLIYSCAAIKTPLDREADDQAQEEFIRKPPNTMVRTCARDSATHHCSGNTTAGAWQSTSQETSPSTTPPGTRRLQSVS